MDQDNLPKVNEYESGETESINRFKLLLSPRLFEIREEIKRDKGVDLVIELKHNDRYTNFRFIIQIKASQTLTIKQDQSISYPVAVSNINYLMNYAMPGYYVLYNSQTESFYIEKNTTVYEKLTQQYPAIKPENFTVRFSTRLDEQQIEEIHAENYQRGLLLAQIKPLMQLNIENKKLSGGVIIDENAQVYSDTDILDYLERYGIALINTGQDRKVIELLKRCRNEIHSPLIHFIAGTAFSHLSQLVDALGHFKKAEEKKDELSPDLQNLLLCFKQTARYTLGMISKDEFRATMNELMRSDYLGLYLRVEQAYRQFYDGTPTSPQKVQQFYEEINAIKKDPDADQSIQIIADAQTLLLEGDLLNDNLHRTLSLMRILPGGAILLSPELKKWFELVKEHHGRTEFLRNAALANGNTHAHHIICINHMRSQYRSYVTSKYLKFFNEDTLTVDLELDSEDQAILVEQIRFLAQIVAEAESRESYETVVSAWSLIYELQRLKKDDFEAGKTATRIREIIEGYELNLLKEKFQRLVNGGTAHEQFLQLLIERFEQMGEETKEFDQINRQIDAFEEKEKAIVDRIAASATYAIQLFPLGNFRIPKIEWEKALNILHVQGEPIKAQFTAMAKGGILPIANVYNDPIIEEGPARGKADFKGLVSMRNIYRIREEFFHNGFYRL